ncbi:NAD(P)-dependent oxidoreductase, partial [Streptomyces griseus]|uniref:NAD(P)-dependent oxidoreductase n=1 Tax=Streptomyces griseus TaxID=1911 RepID=UPI00214BB809
MRITVFGATGGVGQEIVGQALAAGHEVTAVVRDPDRLPERLDRAALAAVVRLDDPAAVRAAVAGRDAVLSGLGSRGRRADGVAERLTGRILTAMEAGGVGRLVKGPAAAHRPPGRGCSAAPGRQDRPGGGAGRAVPAAITSRSSGVCSARAGRPAPWTPPAPAPGCPERARGSAPRPPRRARRK